MKDNIKLGDRFWICCPTIESESHGEYEPVLPWYAEVTRIIHPGYKLSRVGANDKPDEDMNASAFCKPEDLCGSLSEAKDVYRKAVRNHISKLEKHIEYWTNVLLTESV